MASPETLVECHRLQRVLDSGSQAHPLMTVAQQRAQTSLLARRHPDRWKAILGQQRQQQARIPPIMLLFACFCSADFRWMTDAAFDPQLFHHFQKPLHRAGRFDPCQNRTSQCGIKLPDGLAFMFEVFSSSSPVLLSNIAIVCCRACRSQLGLLRSELCTLDTAQGRKTLGRKSRRAEIKGVNVMSYALPDVERFS